MLEITWWNEVCQNVYLKIPKTPFYFGVEYVDVARFILDCPERRINRGSSIAGSSWLLLVHNQRIEHLWGEIIR